jgi:hypothetical protein
MTGFSGMPRYVRGPERRIIDRVEVSPSVWQTLAIPGWRFEMIA